MKTLKGWITTAFLLAALALSAVPAKAGIIYGGLADNKSGCSETSKDSETADDLGGIIYGGFTSAISNLTGIIFGGNLTQEQQNCGVIYGG